MDTSIPIMFHISGDSVFCIRCIFTSLPKYINFLFTPDICTNNDIHQST